MYKKIKILSYSRWRTLKKSDRSILCVTLSIANIYWMKVKSIWITQRNEVEIRLNWRKWIVCKVSKEEREDRSLGYCNWHKLKCVRCKGADVGSRCPVAASARVYVYVCVCYAVHRPECRVPLVPVQKRDSCSQACQETTCLNVKLLCHGQGDRDWAPGNTHTHTHVCMQEIHSLIADTSGGTTTHKIN